MWIFTEDGFYSAVQDRENKDLIMVRSRQRQDLEKLILCLARNTKFNGMPILETVGTDYKYRMLIHRSYWVAYLMAKGDQMDYPNFKGRVVPGNDARSKAYHAVWGVMKSWQDGLYKDSPDGPMLPFMDPLPTADPGPHIWDQDLGSWDLGPGGWDDLHTDPIEDIGDIPWPEDLDPLNELEDFELVLAVAKELLDRGADVAEVSDQLLESFNLEDVKKALQVTNDVILTRVLKETLDK